MEELWTTLNQSRPFLKSMAVDILLNQSTSNIQQTLWPDCLPHRYLMAQPSLFCQPRPIIISTFHSTKNNNLPLYCSVRYTTARRVVVIGFKQSGMKSAWFSAKIDLRFVCSIFYYKGIDCTLPSKLLIRSLNRCPNREGKVLCEA